MLNGMFHRLFHSNLGAIAAVVIGSLFLVILLIAIVIVFKRRARRASEPVVRLDL